MYKNVFLYEKTHRYLKNDYQFFDTLKGIVKPCTHLNPSPSTSTQLHPAHFSLHPALCNPLNNIWTKVLHVIGQFPQI